MARPRKNKNVIGDIVAIVLMAAFTYFINRGIRLSGLYMDDLYLWSFFDELSFKDFVTPVAMASTRLRPIYWLAAWLEMTLLGTHIWMVVPINLCIVLAIAIWCYFFINELSESRLIACFASLAIIASRFSYYDVSQLMGLVESLSMFFALLICWELYKYMHDGKGGRFYVALLFYLAVSFTHERYMVLIPMFYYALITTKCKRILRYVVPALAFAFILAMRLYFLGSLSPAGTGGTEVAETFTIGGFFDAVVAECKYLVGFNAGPEYLCGIEWGMVSDLVKTMVYIGLAIMVIVLIRFIIAMIKNRKVGKSTSVAFRDFVFFLGFIIGCVVASSVTIRVEMRWLYSSFIFMIFLLTYMFGYVKRSGKKSPNLLAAILLVLFILLILEDFYYRQYWNNIYLFQNQNRYNSLSDVTWGKYDEGIKGKKIYIIGNSYEMSDFTGREFFKPFFEDHDSQTEVIHVESIEEIPDDAWNNDIILQEDTENNRFIEIGNLIST